MTSLIATQFNIILFLRGQLKIMKFYGSTQIIAAHRGLASLYPENTMEAFKAAIELIDYIELDVVLTKHGELIVCHDVFLSTLTDIVDFPEYSDRKKTRIFYGQEKNDWWVSDFTVHELKRLKVKQCILQRKSDHRFQIPTLSEVLEFFLNYNQLNKAKKGILLEIKDNQYHQSYMNQNIAQNVLLLLQKYELNKIKNCEAQLPLAIMGFDVPILEFIRDNSDLPKVLLLWSEDKQLPSLEKAKQYTDILGFDIKLCWDHGQQTKSQMIEEALQLQFPIFIWTYQDDDATTLALFQTENPKEIYEKTFPFANGIITEFPQSICQQ